MVPSRLRGIDPTTSERLVFDLDDIGATIVGLC
jgi:hypothetical protein